MSLASLSRAGSETFLPLVGTGPSPEPDNLSDLSSFNLSNLYSIASLSHTESDPSSNQNFPYHDEIYRLSTFEDAMEGLEGSILARCGFFYDARLRRVECFSCHVRHDFTNREDASLYRHLATCDFANGHPTGNIPREITNNRGRTSASVSSARAVLDRMRNEQSNNRSPTQSRDANRTSSNRVGRPRSRPSMEEEQPSSRLSTEEEPTIRRERRDVGRTERSTRDRRENDYHNYEESRRREETSQNSEASTRRNSVFTRGVDLRTPLERERENQFPCLNPRHPHMRSVEDRVHTFGRGWRPFHTECPPREIAEAGMFFVGPNDETICWYCGGGLENWEYNDDPFVEHAKYHPVCEHLLQKKGTDYVQRINRENSTMPRRNVSGRVGGNFNISENERRETFRPSSPPSDFEVYPQRDWERRETRHPDGSFSTVYRAPGVNISMNSYSTPPPNGYRLRSTTTTTTRGPTQNNRAAVAEAMRGQVAQQVTGLGFLLDDMEDVIRRRLETVGRMYTSVTEMVDDLVELDRSRSAEGAEEPAVIPEVQSGPEVLFSSREPVNQDLCQICNVQPRRLVFIPCGHYTTCIACGEPLDRCNTCRQPIINRIEVQGQ